VVVEGVRRAVTSTDVNQYLREISGEDISAKDFRTWAGTVLAAYALQEFEKVDSQAAAKRNLTRAIQRVASRLGNTPAVCRRCYVHPEVVSAYLEGSLLEEAEAEAERTLREELSGLTPEEAVVLSFLQQRLARDLAPGRGRARAAE
jgi:DNA topoisomerase-1